MPVPVPAVMQLRKETTIPITQDFTVKTELITPTGLALLKAMDPIFEPIPSHFAIQSVGYGFGKRDTGKFNALRGSLLMEDSSHSTTIVHHTDDRIVEITTTIDDQTPEQLAYILNRFLDAGALDIYYRSIVMKKNRPGFELTLLIQTSQLEDFQPSCSKKPVPLVFDTNKLTARSCNVDLNKSIQNLVPLRLKSISTDPSLRRLLNMKTVSVLLRRCSCRFKKFITNYKNIFINLGDIY
ncbi:LarC1 [Streptococcus sp. ZB199]|nr:LarC1 [Streptococcus sp. ZB199]